MSDSKKGKDAGKQTAAEIKKKGAADPKAEADKKKNPDLGFLEEDDDFEEFPAEGKFVLFGL